MTVDVLCAFAGNRRNPDLCAGLAGCRVSRASVNAGPDLDDVIEAESPDLIVVDPARVSGRDVPAWIRSVRERPDPPDVVVVHDRDDPAFRAAVLAAGGLAVLNASLEPETLRATMRTLVERRREFQRLAFRADGRGTGDGFRDLVSRSPRMREFVALVEQVRLADTSLLLLGETGTGKERIARAIHVEGPRAAGPFVPVNCGAIPESLLESELFGHERGSFTGAVRARKGYFEQADAGTLFLDEIGELPAHLQVKLLRVIEHREVRRVGAERSFPVDVRVVAATNRDLDNDVRSGRFRRDLYYRLAVVTLSLPALRERREDIPELCRMYLDRFRRGLDRPIEGIEDDAMTALANHDWPGNVRELINVIERATLLSKGPRIGRRDLPRPIAGEPSGPAPDTREVAAAALRGADPAWFGKRFPEARREFVRAFELEYLTRLLRESRGRIGVAAGRAGIDERSLYDALKRHGLRKEDFRG